MTSQNGTHLMPTYDRVIENLVLTSTMKLDGPEWDNTLIRNVTIENVDGDGIMLRNVQNVRIENVTIRNVSGDGIKLSTLGSTSNVVIASSTIARTGGDGINAGQREEAGVDHTGLQILGNTIDTTGLNGNASGMIHGMYVQCTDFVIEGNRILNSTDGNAISARSSGVIRNNYIETTRESGIAYFADHAAGPSDTLLIENNTLVNTGNGTRMSDINLLYVPDGAEDTAVGTVIIRNNTMTDDDGQPIDVSADYARIGIPVLTKDNHVVGSAAAALGFGTAAADSIAGGEVDDALKGFGGDDVLTGNGGDDWGFGGEGNDTLDGGAGNDFLDGGAGSDWVSFTGSVAASVNLGLTGAQNTGFGVDRFASIENVSSGAGNDRLTGNDSANSLVAGDGNDVLFGMRGDDRLNGARGNDRLNGRAGNDTLIGGAGADKFVFDTGLDPTNIDRIADFDVALDVIELKATVFAGIATGALSKAAFNANADGVAKDAQDRIIYETDTGNLFYDSDGTGAGQSILFGSVSAGLDLTSADFLIV